MRSVESATDRAAAVRYTPPWFFLFLLVPNGVVNGFNLIALPYLLKERGLSVAQTSSVVALALLPQALKPLLAPFLDLGMRRRNAQLVFGLLATLLLMAALHLLERGRIGLLTSLLVLLAVILAICENAIGCLCATTVAAEQKGQAAGFYSAGLLFWNGLFGAVLLLLHTAGSALTRYTAPMSLSAIGLVLAAPMILCTLLALWVPEPKPQRAQLRAHLRAVFGDAAKTLRARAGWTGLVICVSPLCAAGATNLFSAIGSDYHASPDQITLATGLSASLGIGVGAIIGGRLSDTLGRRQAYLFAGLLLGGCAVCLALLPRRPEYYVFGCLLYSLATGIGTATFFSFVFEMLSPSAGATTTYGFFVGGAWVATSYVTFLDGQMYRYGGLKGLLGCDAATNLIGAIIVGFMIYIQRSATAAPDAPPALQDELESSI